MARPDTKLKQRDSLIPVVARTFAELGYRRTTTAELARRCRVQEPILYRLWNDKKAMFLAAIDHVYESSVAAWSALADGPGTGAARQPASSSTRRATTASTGSIGSCSRASPRATTRRSAAPSRACIAGFTSS